MIEETTVHSNFLCELKHILKRRRPELYAGTLSDLSNLKRDALEINENIGNNSFSYTSGRSLYVAPVCEYRKDSKIEAGRNIVFVDKWDEELKRCCGLKKFFVGRTGNSNTPFYLCDNHNLVLEAWSMVKDYSPKLKLVHIDQHRDDAKFAGDQNNWLLDSRICDYIDFAKCAGWIDAEHLSFTESAEFAEGVSKKHDNRYILNIDLDLFAPDVTHVTTEDKILLIQSVVPDAELITIATSPGFIDAERAIPLAELLLKYL